MCEKCGGPTNMMVQVTVVAPSSMAHEFSKRNLRKKEVEIWGVNWEAMDLICLHCGRMKDGYGNYVSRLEKENKRLKGKDDPNK